MNYKLKNFKITDHTFVPIKSMPEGLSKLAKKAFNNMTGGMVNPQQVEIEQMISISLKLLEYSKDIDLMKNVHFEDMSDETRLHSVLTTVRDEIPYWKELIPNADYRDYEIHAAYVLMKIDEFADSIDVELNDEMLDKIYKIAYELSVVNFYHGFEDYTDMQKSDGIVHAINSNKMRAIKQLENYAVDRFNAGKDGKPWKSLRTCANSIANDVVDEANKLNWKMSKNEPWRTVYGWLREASKR